MSYSTTQRIIEDGLRKGIRAALSVEAVKAQLDAFKVQTVWIKTFWLPKENDDEATRDLTLPCIVIQVAPWTPQGYQAPLGNAPCTIHIITNIDDDPASDVHCLLYDVVRGAFDAEAKTTGSAFTFAAGVSLRGFLIQQGTVEIGGRGQQTMLPVDLKITVAQA